MFLTASLFFCALSFIPAFADSVMIKGKRLAEISDIVKTVTDSDFPELPKHSLLLYERYMENTSTVRYLPIIFTIKNDGSLMNEYTFDSHYDEGTRLPVSPKLDVIQKMDLSISPKPFGMRRNIVYSTAGLSSEYYSRYGLITLENDSTRDNTVINAVAGDNIETDNARSIWGNACLAIEGREYEDIFVVAHSSKMGAGGNLYLKFLSVNREETDSIGYMNDVDVDGGDSQGWKVLDYSSGIRGCAIAAGDIDGDGHRNEIALTFNSNGSAELYVFSVKKSGDSRLNVTQLHREVIHEGASWGNDGYSQACPNVVVGDFDGDGVDEAAFVGRIENSSMRVGIVDYNGGSWRYDSESYGSGGNEAPCRAARCDFDGDGKDEFAILFFQESGAGILYPRLERWYCDKDSIKPHRDSDRKKGGAGDSSVLGYTTENTNSYYKDIEEFSIIAGPLTGTRGKFKLADDVAISHVYTDASRVFVIPTQLDLSRDFAGFGDSQKIYEDTDSDTMRRGALITADFANESLMLGKPSHTQDEHDESYVAVLQALPYHVDNVDADGELTDEPINYTFSGFGDMSGGIKGEMSVRYNITASESQNKNVSFGLASTTETISVLGKAGPYVHGYLKFRATEANIVGNFDPRVKAAAGVMNELMDFVTDKIDNTTTNASSSAHTDQISTTLEAKQYDALITYTAPQHIWRYKILNKPLPVWYVLGPKADYVSEDFSGAESQDRYITFSMYDTATPSSTYSDRHYAYQARHEEGNFFSYPSLIEDIEGYTAGGDLIGSPYSAEWNKSESGMMISFDQSKIDSQNYDEHVQKSALSKTISAIASFFGAKDPTGLPSYTSHSEAFVKKNSTSEAIDIRVYGRTDLPGEDAVHTLMAMPYTAREGTLKVGTAVQLSEAGTGYGPALWDTESRYSQFADPSLVLPHKYVMRGTKLVASHQKTASKARGIRYYIPALGLDSDRSILGGLEYKISIPIYNASFKDTGSFDVSLSYVMDKNFNLSKPNETIRNIKHIQTVTMSLQGWQNGSRLNKGWADFTWKVPDNLSDGSYYFYVQIDPDHKLPEVHESRVSADNTVIDVGGNNEGYFVFEYTSPGTMVDKQNRKVNGSFKAAAHTGNGTILRTAYRRGESDGGKEGVKSAMSVYDTTGTVNVNAKIEGYDDVNILYLLELFAEIAAADSSDSIPVECEIEYSGDEYYHEAYFYGVRYKAGALDAVNGDYSKISDDAVKDYFLVDRLPLVPGETVRIIMNLHSGDIDWVNGSGFQLVVPELAADEIIYSDDVDGGTSDESDSGGDSDSGGEVGVSSSSGGCETGVGIFAAMILTGALTFRTMKRR